MQNDTDAMHEFTRMIKSQIKRPIKQKGTHAVAKLEEAGFSSSQ